MNAKRLLLFPLLFCFLLIGCKKTPSLRCRLTYEGVVVLDEEYDLKFGARKQKDLFADFSQSGLTALQYLRALNASLAEDIEEACDKVSFPKKEPEILYEGDGAFRYTEGKAGRAASADEVAALFIENNGVLRAELPVRAVPTVFTESDLTEHTKKMSSFSTDYSSSSPERKHNVALAVKKLDNRIIEAGEELSFNQAVGKRTKENGFEEAGVILNGRFTRGVGGGVCQVSTTLYNAWNLSGLDATGKNHSLTVSYVPAGLDAMVSETSDLVLINNGEFPVFLDADCDGNKVTFTLYGTPAEECRLWSEKIKTIPCDEYEITEGEEEKILSYPKDGCVYRSYRDRYKNGVRISREELRTSFYNKVKGVKISPKKKLFAE